MAYSSHPSRLESPSSAERRSGWAFSVILAVVLLAISLPELPPQALQGIMWAVAGAVMIVLPPEQSLPRFWWIAGLGFLIFSALGFLPKESTGIPAWRSGLEALGLDTGTRIYEQPQLAAEGFVGFAATAAIVLFMLGHRVNTLLHLRLALVFAIAAGFWTAAALVTHGPNEVFGFFPNRNHTASLLAMAAVTGIGVLSQAIRLKLPWIVGLAAIPTVICVYALLVVSVSRAGFVLLAAGIFLWLITTKFRACRGHAGKAVLLLLGGFAGLFLIVDSRVKDRLTESVENLKPATTTSDITFGEEPVSEAADIHAEGRILIYRDTISMIRGEPWTGVGPGQFARVFPQYRNLTNAPNDYVCLHPESDWLMMVAETGTPATALLGAGTIAAFATGLGQIRQGRAKLLRAGTLVAASMLCLHGVFDVPGHRVGLAWLGAFLLALSLRPSTSAASGENTRGMRFGRATWRVAGLVMVAAGTVLLHAQWTGSPLLPSSRKSTALLSASALYQADQVAYEKATAEGRDYQPTEDEDPLMKALAGVDDAIHISPLDPNLHSIRANLALHYDDKHTVAEQAQAIQLRLEPLRVSIAISQAKAWLKQDPSRAALRWDEALRRATLLNSRDPMDQFALEKTFRRMLQDAGWKPPFSSLTAQAAVRIPELAEIWAKSAPLKVLDEEMPKLLENAPDSSTRQALQSIQLSRRPASKTN